MAKNIFVFITMNISALQRLENPCIGDSFIKLEVHEKRGLEEIIIMPDYWVMKIEQDCK